MIKSILKKISQVAKPSALAVICLTSGVGKHLMAQKGNLLHGWYYENALGEKMWHETRSRERKKEREEKVKQSSSPKADSEAQIVKKNTKEKQGKWRKFGVGIVVLIENGKNPTNPYTVLIERGKEPNGLALVGGSVENDEKPEDAAIEEVHEELSIDLDPSLLRRKSFSCNGSPDQCELFPAVQHFYELTLPAHYKSIVRPGDDAKNVYLIPLNRLWALMQTQRERNIENHSRINRQGNEITRQENEVTQVGIRKDLFGATTINLKSHYPRDNFEYPFSLGWALQHDQAMKVFLEKTQKHRKREDLERMLLAHKERGLAGIHRFENPSREPRSSTLIEDITKFDPWEMQSLNHVLQVVDKPLHSLVSIQYDQLINEIHNANREIHKLKMGKSVLINLLKNQQKQTGFEQKDKENGSNGRILSRRPRLLRRGQSSGTHNLTQLDQVMKAAESGLGKRSQSFSEDLRPSKREKLAEL